MAKAIPDGYHTATPYLIVKGAAQAIEFRRPLQSSPQLERVHDAVRAVVPRLHQDRVLAPDIDALASAIRSGAFNAWLENA